MKKDLKKAVISKIQDTAWVPSRSEWANGYRYRSGLINIYPKYVEIDGYVVEELSEVEVKEVYEIAKNIYNKQAKSYITTFLDL